MPVVNRPAESGAILLYAPLLAVFHHDHAIRLIAPDTVVVARTRHNFLALAVDHFRYAYAAVGIPHMESVVKVSVVRRYGFCYI